MKILTGLFGLLIATQTLWSQDGSRKLSDFPPPKAPFVRGVPEKASWVIVAQGASPEEKDGEILRAKPRVGSIDSFRNGEIKRDLITYQTGRREEVWYFQDQALSSTDSGKVVVRSQALLENEGNSTGAFRALGNSFKSAGFPGVNWVDQKNYSGLVMFNKTIPTYHYVLKGKDVDSGTDVTAAEAWIHAETGLPVAYVAEGSLYVYRFGEAPGGSPSLPPAFEAAYQKVRQAQDRQRRLEADAAALQ